MFKITSGPYSIIEPEPELVRGVKLTVASEVKKTFPPGQYRGDSEKLNSIAKHLVSEYNRYLEQILEKIASNETLKALLWQYSECDRWEIAHPNPSTGVTIEQISDVKNKARAFKFLAERCAALQQEHPKCTNPNDCVIFFAEALVCAEQIVLLSTVSDQIAFGVIVSDFVIIIPSEDELIQVHGNKANFEDFARRLTLSNQNRSMLFLGNTFDVDVESLSNSLEPAFSQHLLLTFNETLSLAALIDNYSKVEPDSSYNTKLIAKDKINGWMKTLTYDCVTDEQIDIILSGLTVSPYKVAASDRTFFNPQLESRALKRCFFETTFKGRPHLMWVSELVDKAVEAIPKDVSFGELPTEWILSQYIKDNLAAIKKNRGDWFEDQVARIVGDMGLVGLHSIKSIGRNQYAIKVVPGELDFIGWSQADQALILFEDKMLKWAAEPKHVKNQNQRFLDKGGFVDRIKMKVHWVMDNLDAVIKALKSEGVPVGEPVSINTAFITFEPLFASYYVENYPVVSIAEFVEDYSKKGAWPYSDGVQLLSKQ